MLRIGQIEVTAQNNKYTDGNVAGGVPATRLRAAALNALQEEVAGVVESAGLDLDPDDFGQMLKALKRLFAEKTDSLGALAALTGAKDKLPYFTGANAATLTDLTSVGRDILASATKAAVLEYLGLGDLPDFGTAAEGDIGNGPGQIPDMSFFTSLLDPTNGWAKFPGGMILQCVHVSGETGNVATAKPFPTPFPTAAIGVFVCCRNTTNGVMAQASIVDRSTFRITFRSYSAASTTSNDSGYIFAMGY